MSLCGMSLHQMLVAINIYACIATAVVVFAMDHWHCKHEKREAYEKGHQEGVLSVQPITMSNAVLGSEYPEVEAQYPTNKPKD